MSYKSYKDLIVWQKSMDLVDEIYSLVKLLPKEELYALSDQLRRSAVSIPSNIAEGYGRHGHKVLSQFLSIARGSVFELETPGADRASTAAFLRRPVLPCALSLQRNRKNPYQIDASVRFGC